MCLKKKSRARRLLGATLAMQKMCYIYIVDAKSGQHTSKGQVARGRTRPRYVAGEVFFFRKNGKSFAVDFIRRYKEKKRANTTLYLHPASPAKQNGKLVKRQKKQLHRRKKVKRIDEINQQVDKVDLTLILRQKHPQTSPLKTSSRDTQWSVLGSVRPPKTTLNRRTS